MVVIAPGTGHVHVVAPIAPRELGTLQAALHRREALFECLQITDDEASVPPEHLRRARGQVELLVANVHPDVREPTFMYGSRVNPSPTM